MMSKIEALKKLAVSVGCAESIEKVEGASIVEVINFIADNYPGSEALKTLTITSVAGDAFGTTKITVVPTLTAGNSYGYMTNPTKIDEPNYLDSASEYTTWNGTDAIEVEDGHYIAIVELNADKKIVKFGQATAIANLG
jgi:hypothetical protein